MKSQGKHRKLAGLRENVDEATRWLRGRTGMAFATYNGQDLTRLNVEGVVRARGGAVEHVGMVSRGWG